MFLHQKISIFLAIPITATAIVMSAPLFVFGATNGPGNMTVDDCVSRTGQTKEQCSEMINKFKNMTDEERAKMTPPQGGQNKIPVNSTNNENPGISKEGSKSDSTGVNNDGLLEKASKMKAEKESQFDQIEKRIAKIIEFLNSNSIESDQVSNDFETFKEEASSVLTLFDVYIKALNDGKNNSAESSAASLQDARSQIENAMKNLTDFYSTTLRNDLSSAIGKLQQ
jgi:soluble cytochrome b562